MREPQSNIGDLVEKRLKEFEVRQRALQKETQGPVARPSQRPVVITISREYGAGGHTIAQMVQARLGPDWTVWDRNIVDFIAERESVRRHVVEALDEDRRHWLTAMFEAMLGTGMDETRYKHRLVEVVLALAQQGKKIIIGRGANYILRDALNVRLVASLEFRMAETMRRLGCSRDEALHELQRTDARRAEAIKQLFQARVDDPCSYDMVLRTDALGYETAADIVVAAARCIFGTAL